MTDSFWRPISIDSIDTETFPEVSMFIRTSGNYVLYKDRDTAFREEDRRRLERGNVQFVYVRSGDMAEVNEYIEKNIVTTLSRNDLDSASKGRVLYQSSVNCVVDMFESPETATNLERCRNLLRQMMKFIATEPLAMSSLHSVASQNFYIFTHSVQVAALNLLVHAQLFNLDRDEMLDVGTGSLLHDFGMIFITSEVMDKPDALSDVEYFKVKQHTQHGYDFLKRTGGYDELALTIVRHHHERYDGNGYPAGLKGDAIPRSAQVSAICDMYSALSLDRVYRQAVPHQEAIQIMAEEAQGGAFNPELFKRFAEVVTAHSS